MGGEPRSRPLTGVIPRCCHNRVGDIAPHAKAMLRSGVLHSVPGRKGLVVNYSGLHLRNRISTPPTPTPPTHQDGGRPPTTHHPQGCGDPRTALTLIRTRTLPPSFKIPIFPHPRNSFLRWGDFLREIRAPGSFSWTAKAETTSPGGLVVAVWVRVRVFRPI